MQTALPRRLNTCVDVKASPRALAVRGAAVQGRSQTCLNRQWGSPRPVNSRSGKLTRPDRQSLRVKASNEEDNEPVQYNKDFGYSRKDVILIGVGIIALGYAMYYGAQAVGIEANAAGNYVQLFIFLVICVGYVSTYIFRVANKGMTYARQLEAYEEMVMQKRLEEMPETERERLLAEVESERERRAARSKQE